MRDFWRLARLMLRDRTLLIGAIVFSILSSAGLTVGLMGVVPVVSNVLTPGGGTNLRKLAEGVNPKIGNLLPQAFIDRLTTDPFLTVVYVLGALCILALVGGVCMFMNLALAHTVVARAQAHIRAKAFAHTIRMPLSAVQATGPKQIVNQIVFDAQTLALGFIALLNKTIAQLMRGVAALAFALITNWLLTLVAIAVIVPLAWAVSLLAKRIKRAAGKWLTAQGAILVTASESLDHIRVVKTSTAERRAERGFEHVSHEMLRQELKIRATRAFSSPLVEVVSVFLICGLTIAAAQFILTGKLHPAEFLVTLAALGIAGESLRPLTVLHLELQPSAAAAERLSRLLAEPVEDIDGAELPALPRHAQSIRFERVRFTYPGQDHPAIDDFTLDVRHGETVAFVGPNGSGKTTILSLLPRLLTPDSGRILIDGHDVAAVALRSLREQIGVVTQEAVLFKGDIRSNITYAVESATDEQVRAAAQRARAEEFILRKPGGYNAPIGEGGSGLSGGQKQRIAIARAILRDPAILILDEATSMIDADSEAKIAEALDDFSQGRTCLVVAHRLSTVVHADRIVVMDHGRIADIGTHDQLLSRCDVYRLIAENQLVRAAT